MTDSCWSMTRSDISTCSPSDSLAADSKSPPHRAARRRSAHCGRWEFDVAVVDLKMEDMDGIEVLKVLKKMDPALQVIMLTGHGSERAARDGIAQGAFDYLIKPIGLDPLIARIRAALSSDSA